MRPSPGCNPARLPEHVPPGWQGSVWGWANVLSRIEAEYREMRVALRNCGREPSGSLETYRSRRVAELCRWNGWG